MSLVLQAAPLGRSCVFIPLILVGQAENFSDNIRRNAAIWAPQANKDF